MEMTMTMQPIFNSSKGRISLETYIDFIRSDKQSNLPIFLLTQILRMHGFRKCSAPKTTLMEELKIMELMDPCRSTLSQDKISPKSFMTIEQILKDVDDLKWNECCITSIKTLNSVEVDSVPILNRNNDTPEVSSKSKSFASVKTKRVSDLYDGGSQLTDTDLFAAKNAKKAGEISNTSSNHLTKRVRWSTTK